MGPPLYFSHPACLEPALVGLSEVENTRVARDLLAATGWGTLRIVADPRARLAGDDVVLFHDPAVLSVSGTPQSHNVHNRYATRDLFEVDFTTPSGDDLAVIAAHWPSRRISNSEALRIGLADYTMRLVENRLKYGKDELIDDRGRASPPGIRALEQRWERPLVVMGDLNDNPFDTSVSEVLGATRARRAVLAPPRFPRGRGISAVESYLDRRVRLYNPMWRVLADDAPPEGTYYWSGDWYLLDQVILSRGLLTDRPVSYREGSLTVHGPRTVPGPDGPIAVTSAQGVPIAFDATRGTGASDHLPLTFTLDIG